jgi:hypothetical protein
MQLNINHARNLRLKTKSTMDICMYWKINVFLTMRKSLQLTNLKSFVHGIMIYDCTQWEKKKKKRQWWSVQKKYVVSR